jgi:hypothetical protein
MKTKLSLTLLTLLCSVNVHAMPFQTIGYKSVAMGGACVANSLGSNATYDNPALLAKTTYDVELSLGVGAGIYDHGAGASVQALSDSGFIDTLDTAQNNTAGLTLNDIDTLIDGKNIILNMNGDSVEIAPHVYFATQVGSFGFGLFGATDIIASAVISQDHNRLIVEDTTGTYGYVELLDNATLNTNVTATDYVNSSIEYAINNNLTYLEAKGFVLAEIPVAYGHKFELSNGNLMVGGALKYMEAITYIDQMSIDDFEDSDENTNDKTSSSFGIDLGLAYEPNLVPDLTIGLVIKNINKPTFSFVDGTDIEIKPMLRTGVAYAINDSLEIAADLDLSKNETLIYGLKSQMLGGGVSFHPVSWFALRGGAMKNLDSNDQAALIYTAGIGFGLKWLQLDLSGEMSSKTNTVEGTEYARYAKVNFALISRW